MRAILPALHNPFNKRIQSFLQLLVLSGELLHLSLWNSLKSLLPKTSILNLYGSTEVSGDCTYFDCKRLPLIMETEEVSSVPIGMPLSNCDVVLVGENAPSQGEICVRGPCVVSGYFHNQSIVSLECTSIPQDSLCDDSVSGCTSQHYFKTGDFARRLPGGELIFLGRRDRTIKVNGQRIALEEVETTLGKHPAIVDAAVISCEGQRDLIYLEAYLVTTNSQIEYAENLRISIRNWLVGKLPPAMIPSSYVFVESLPMSSTGKVDYKSLTSSKYSMKNDQDIDQILNINLLQVIKKAFSDALMVKEVSNDDDFFKLGGNSITAAHVSYCLGIDMRLLYAFPNPWKLEIALAQKEGCSNHNLELAASEKVDKRDPEQGAGVSSCVFTSESFVSKPHGRLFSTLTNKNPGHPFKYMKIDSSLYATLKNGASMDGSFWNSSSISMACSFSRSNKVMYGGEYQENNLPMGAWSLPVSREKKGSLREVWKVDMESCVDASPLLVTTEGDTYLFIGSHSRKFVCIRAKSGFVQWQIKLKGRVECSAAILGDFSQVVVGCYGGNIYFLNFANGSTCWTFQTYGEVKSQPVVDKDRHLIWCGSYDHNLYALDYRNYCCIYQLGCGGSIFGSPAIDEVHGKLYVASTAGRLTALFIKEFPFAILWLQELDVPIFGSLSISSDGNVICCLVDGHVVALDVDGSVVWRVKTGGPIFAGPCTSSLLPSQVLICSRDGSVYSFNLENGDIFWTHHIGDPITSSAYVDENLELLFDDSCLPEGVVCVATSSGSICLLRIQIDAFGELSRSRETTVLEFARFDLQGDVFSSPVMISGRIFVGCRDDYVYCIGVDNIT